VSRVAAGMGSVQKPKAFVQADSPVEASRGRKHALRMLGGGLDAWQARVVEVLRRSV
jgi:hypothetical protein